MRESPPYRRGRQDGLLPLVRADGTTLPLTSLAGAALYAVIDSLGHSPAYAACRTPSRARTR
ncbi:hypothetical protein [Streptomyces griseofuscus]|uniref:hypothetical protein n=1 Tax=Streptomyces griseofuscus TaxID=146922 RepID=UPI003451E83C